MPELTATSGVTVFDGTRWIMIDVPAEPAPKPRKRPTRHAGRPVSRDGLSGGSPWAESLDDTAYAPATGPAGWADMRRHIPETHIRTHRPATVWPAGTASNATAGTRWHDLDR